MRLPPVCLMLSGALALTASAGPARADGGSDAGTGGTETGTTTTTGTTGSGSFATTCSGGLGGGGGPPICPSTTSDNFGCDASGAGRGPTGAGAALLVLGLAVAGSRRRRRAGLLSLGALLAALLPSPARADTPPAPAAPPAGPPASPPPAAPPAQPSLYTPADQAAPTEAQPARVRFGFGAHITTDYLRSSTDVSMGLAPPRGGGDALGIAAFVELGRGEGSGIWAPLVRITGTRSVMSVDTASATASATASVTLLKIAADFCPIAPMLASRLWVRPCVQVGGGLLGASANVGSQSLSAHAPWVTAGLLARLTWRPVGPLFFEAQGGASYAFLHDELDIALSSGSGSMGTLPVFKPAQLEPFGGLGLGLTFP